MEKTWRWFGKNDPITLPMLKQIGVEGIVTALYDIAPEVAWTTEDIKELNDYIRAHGFKWSVVESVPVAETVKYGGIDRDEAIEAFCTTITRLGELGIRTVCYNFMPVIDWIRTDLNKLLPDGTRTLYFNKIRFAYFDCKIINRKNASNDYSPEELAQVEELHKIITQEEIDELIDNIIVKTQRFINRKIGDEGQSPVEAFKELLSQYHNIDKNILRENMKYFLQKVIPVAEKANVNLCVHPDDPPFAVLGLPRIVTRDEDIEWILQSVDNIRNGLTFCAGSLSAGSQNNIPYLAEKYAKRIHFAHLRSTTILENNDFLEASHLGGRAHLIDTIRILEKANPKLPMRVDHGKLMLDDGDKNYNPGYTFLGRMFALAQIDGVMAVVKDELTK